MLIRISTSPPSKGKSLFLKFLICKRIKVFGYLEIPRYISRLYLKLIIFDPQYLLPFLELLMLQNNALSHHEKRGVNAPRLIARDSVTIFSISDRIHSGHCCVRMLSWVRGRVFADFQPQSLQLMESLGRLLATVDNVRGWILLDGLALTVCARD